MSGLFNWLKKKQGKQVAQSDSTETNQGNSALQAEASQSAKSSHLSCDNIPLYTFKKAYCNDDFKLLYSLITGTDEDKQWRWKVILEEYSWQMKNEDGDNLFELAKKIYILKTHIAAVDWCAYYLNNYPFDKGIADKMSEVFPMDYSIKSNINKALVMIDTKRYELEILSDEYSRLQGNSKGERQSEKSFNEEIAAVSKFMGYPINEFKTMVTQYTSMYQNCIASIRDKK